MPMNVARLNEYILAYDVDLDASWVAMDGKIIFGLGMLGVRSGRAWITRVGVLPIGRRQGTGSAIVNRLLESAEQRGCGEVWIEVIAGNVPAQQLFLTTGFVSTRELLVARRPPSQTSPVFQRTPTKKSEISVSKLGRSQIMSCLSERTERLNWLNQSESYLHLPDICGLKAQIDGGGLGWIAYQLSDFQLSHINVEVLDGDPTKVTINTLAALHSRHPSQDAVMENMAAQSPYWPGFQESGYFEVFRRLEMVRRVKI
jgi:N-acetylglutamate synthase-like GNAT family acetyltransferase